MDNTTFPILEALAETAESVAFAYDLDEKCFRYLNPAFEEVWRLTRKSVMDNPANLLKTIHPDDKEHVEQAHQELLNGALLPDTEFRILLHNHAERWIRVKPKFLGEQSIIIGFATDITAQKHHHETLQRHTDKKNSILNILSHDLANPLANIENLSSILSSEEESMENEEVRKMVNLINKNSKKGMQLIQEFVRQEFLESSNVDLVKIRVDLVEKIKMIIQEYQQSQQITSKNFHFYASSEKIFLAVDHHKISQVINNLISNAIKFTPDGGDITISVEEKESAVRVTVADTGIGIPEKYHETLFEKFTNARRPGIKGESSVGLGMSIIKTIIDWHHGKIWFESTEQKGTTFFMELPHA